MRRDSQRSRGGDSLLRPAAAPSLGAAVGLLVDTPRLLPVRIASGAVDPAGTVHIEKPPQRNRKQRESDAQAEPHDGEEAEIPPLAEQRQVAAEATIGEVRLLHVRALPTTDVGDCAVSPAAEAGWMDVPTSAAEEAVLILDERVELIELRGVYLEASCPHRIHKWLLVTLVAVDSDGDLLEAVDPDRSLPGGAVEAGNPTAAVHPLHMHVMHVVDRPSMIRKGVDHHGAARLGRLNHSTTKNFISAFSLNPPPAA